MLKQTRETKEIYEDIQRKIYYMIPDKWEKLYLYASVIDTEKDKTKGELFFYYIPKGILKKNPVNVYEIPSKFNLNEKEYLELVEILYNEIKKLREIYKKIELGETWSNITISIENTDFKIEFKYDDLVNSEYSSFDRHIIWRYQYLNIGMEQLNKEEKEILRKYLTGPKNLVREEVYETGIYIQDIKKIIDYDTTNEEETYIKEDEQQEIEETKNEGKKIHKREFKIMPKKEIEKNQESEKVQAEKPKVQIKNQILSFLNDELNEEDTKNNW
mgnify:FL=1